MLITIRFFDANNNPVPNVTLQYIANGHVINQVSVPNNTGVIYLDSLQDAELLADGVKVKATAPGYTAAAADGAAIAGYSDYTFTMQKTGLNTAVIVGAGMGIGLLLVLDSKRKRKNVSGFNELPPVAQTAIVFGGLGLVAYLMFFNKKPAGAGLPIAAESELQKLAAAGIYPTITQTEAEGFASTLRTAFDDCGTDESTILQTLNGINTTADMYLLIAVYGTRAYKGCFDGDYLSSHPYNLAEALTSELGAGMVAELNDYLHQRGIDFKF